MKKNIDEEVLRIREVMGHKKPLNEQKVKRVISPATQHNWDNLSNHLESTYGYTIEGENKLTYNFKCECEKIAYMNGTKLDLVI